MSYLAIGASSVNYFCIALLRYPVIFEFCIFLSATTFNHCRSNCTFNLKMFEF